MHELPDLSHLTEEERNIILAVMDRRKEEEEKEEAMLKCVVRDMAKPAACKTPRNAENQPHQPPPRLHQQFESYKEQVRKIGEEARRYQGEHKDEAPTCGICRRTKFADGCGHQCSYCHTKFCARCEGRLSLRSNSVSVPGTGRLPEGPARPSASQAQPGALLLGANRHRQKSACSCAPPCPHGAPRLMPTVLFLKRSCPQCAG
ncbi:regulating synaptic membrane exocytosis protein 1-like isoform X1 [Heterocephalus glaber]|uniref:Regulating synaptic membrane exocytosis protein 1-like isoform X1 n=1 Tax=Heterocephalus glaber TaxID=10181 RepID=A0AAX6SA66_HETGA|nr:regulating synaptic membrane exocytosis protein 1-like isoform X1 [Heterocephalus glaber]